MDIKEVKLFTVAQPFKKLGKDELTVDEFTFTLSLDLEWFSPSDAKIVFKNAVESGLITVSGGFLKPVFDIKNVKKTTDFKPDVTVFKSVESVKKPVLDKILERVEKTISKEEFIDLLNKKRNEFGDIINEDVLAILVVKGLDVTIDDLVDETYERLLNKDMSI